MNAKTTEYNNTYDFDRFEGDDRIKELKRLKMQANLVSHIEQKAISEIGFKEDGIFVDVGCGPGFVTGNIAGNYSNLRIIGLDTSRELLNAANMMVKPNYKNLEFNEGDAYSTGLPDNYADVVYSRLLYQHLEHPRKAMAEAKRILKPGGKLCILDVDDQLQVFYPELPSFLLLQESAKNAQKMNGGNRHIGRELSHLMKDVGFDTIDFVFGGVSTLDIGFDAFFEIVVSFKAQIVGDKESYILENLKNEIDSLDRTPFGMAGVPLVIGNV
ncbi:methyltransferase domain-containing protein [bacterium]|jgi:ubiquinone/menaquinone biosynthesis C-methylase UbiE|nr:methyltransferase domain-containing protein [bacterium]